MPPSRHHGGLTRVDQTGAAIAPGAATPPPKLLLTKPLAFIIARDPMTGALIGSLAQVSGFEATFPSETETAATAIARLRPDVVLIDCDSADGDACLTPVSEYGGAVVLFSPWRDEPDVRELASRRGLRHFALPIRWMDFRELLQDVTARRAEE